MKLTLASIVVLAFAAVSAPAFAQSTTAAPTACPPNGNTNSAGIMGKGNQVGAGSGTAQAGTTTPGADCPTAQAPAAAGAMTPGGSISNTPATANSSNGGASNK